MLKRMMSLMLLLLLSLMFGEAKGETVITFPNKIQIIVPSNIPDFTQFQSGGNSHFTFKEGNVLIIDWFDESTSIVYSMLITFTPKTLPEGRPAMLAIVHLESGVISYFIGKEISPKIIKFTSCSKQQFDAFLERIIATLKGAREV